MTLKTLEAVKASAYGADPVGAKRAMRDFQSKTDETRYLDGYQARRPSPINEMLGLPMFGGDDVRDRLIGEREVMVTIQHSVDGDVQSDETWAAFWHEDGNEPNEEGALGADNVTLVRIL